MFATGFREAPSKSVGVLARPRRRRGHRGGDRHVSV